MRKQKIYYRCLGLLIYSVLLILFFACGKPPSEKKKDNLPILPETRSETGTDTRIDTQTETRTEMDEEMEALSNGTPKIEKRLQAKTKIFKIKIFFKKVISPIEEFDRIKLPHCGRGEWDSNEVHYDKSKVTWKNNTTDFVQFAKTDLYFKASSPNGTSIYASLDELIKSKGATISTNPSFIEIKLPSKEWPNSLSGKEELDVELSLTPSKTVINIGNMRELGRQCVRVRPEPSRGVDGAARGGLKGIDSNSKELSGMASFSSLGYSTEVFEVQYDLDVRFVSQY